MSKSPSLSASLKVCAVFVLSAVLFFFSSCKKEPDKNSSQKHESPRPRATGGLRLEYNADLPWALEGYLDEIGDDICLKVLKVLRTKYKRTPEDRVTELFKVEKRGTDLELSFLKDPADAAMVSSPQVLSRYRKPGAPVLDIVSVDNKKGIVHLRLNPAHAVKVKDDWMRQAVKIVRKRLRNFGVLDGSVKREKNRLIVDLPGVGTGIGLRLKNNIARSGRLAFKIVDDKSDHMAKVGRFLTALKDEKKRTQMNPEEVSRYFEKDPQTQKFTWKPGYKRVAEIQVQKYVVGFGSHNRAPPVTYLEHKKVLVLQRFLKALPERLFPPPNREISFGEKAARDSRGRPKKTIVWRTYFLHKKAGVLGTDIEDATVSRDQFAQPEVRFRFGRQGELKFRKLTRSNIGRRLAIVFEGKVQSAPLIKSEIGAKGVINLGSALKTPAALLMEAKNLATVLKSGALPVPLRLAKESPI